MNLFEKLIKGIVNYGTNFGAVFLVAVMLLITINVIYRIFSGVIPGQYELVEIMIVVVAGFAICDTEIHHRQTSVDMVTMRLPRKSKLWLENGCNLIGLVFWALVARETIRLTMDKAAKGEHTDLLQIPIIPTRVIWVVALILVCVIILHNIFKNFKELGRKES